VITRPLSTDGAFGRFADRLLALELPDLPDDRRDETVGFVCRRAHDLPTPLALGVTALTIGTGVAARVLGAERTVRVLGATTIPLVGELARMVRSLGFTFVWERWPDTTPTGGRPAAGAGGRTS
jgi:hypothetical protein